MNIRQYIERKTLKNLFKDFLTEEIIEANEEGDFGEYHIELEAENSTYEGDDEYRTQWVLKVTDSKDNVSFWQIIGGTSSYAGLDISDYWDDFNEVKPTEKVVIVWQ